MRCLTTSLAVMLMALAGFSVPARAQSAGTRIVLAQGRKGAIAARRQENQFLRHLDRLQRMPPEQRRRALNALPPERRQLFERRLEEYARMNPEQRERLARELDNFRQLPPERQRALRDTRRKLAGMPVQRRRQIARELRNLRGMDDEQRRARMDSSEFKERFTEEERQMIGDLSSVLEPEV